jgi:flagellar motor switch protein FliG
MKNILTLKKMSDVKIQTWLRTVDAEDLKRALPGLDDDVQNCIFRNMSPRAVLVLKEFVANNKALAQQVIDLNIKKLEISLNEIAE